MLVKFALGIHEIAAAIAVGGLMFVLAALAPALRDQDGPEALGVWHRTMRLFLRWAAAMMILLWATGLWLMFGVYGGFGKAPHIDTMFLLALIWTGLYFWLNHGPFAAFKRAVTARDFPTAAALIPRIRRLVVAGTVVGIATIAVAAAGTVG